MVLRLLGTAVTDANGLAVLSDGYTGTGAGLVDIIAQATIDESTVVSNTYEVWDTIRYDDGTGDIWSPNSNGSVTMEDNGALFSVSADYGRVYIGSNQQIHPLSSVMEFDVVSETGRVSLAYFNSSQAEKQAFEFNSYSNRGAGHWRVEMTNTQIKFYREGTELSGSPVSVNFGNSPVRICFLGITNGSTIKIANFKEYYI